MTAAGAYGVDTGSAVLDPVRDIGQHFVYQRVHVSGGQIFHLDAHLGLAARACNLIYGAAPEFDRREMTARILSLLRVHRIPSRTSSLINIFFIPRDKNDENIHHSESSAETGLESPENSRKNTIGWTVELEYGRALLDAGYALSSLRPQAVSFEYSVPYATLPTNFQITAQALFDSLAMRFHGAGRSVRREGDRLLACGGAPLFGIRGRRLFFTPPEGGGIESVEAGVVLAAAAKSNLEVIQEPILHSELKSFDELFFADAGGITSLSECDGAKFMSLVAGRLAAAMK